MLMRVLALFVAGFFLAFTGNARAACAPERLATVKTAALPDGRITIPVMVEGHPLSFLLDTGGVSTTIKWDLAKEMGLVIQQTPRRLTGVGGSILNFTLASENFSIGELRVQNRPIYVESRPLLGADGTLGADTLRDYDVEIDGIQNSLSFYASGYCAPPQWGSAVAIGIARGGHVRVPIKIDGTALTAVLDTGAAMSVISMRAAAFLGVHPGAPELIPAGNSGSYRIYAYPFRSLELGGVVVKNPRIAIASDGLIPGNDLVLGFDALSQMHLTIAYGSGRLYIRGPQTN